jgi:hypothetical protein
MFGSNGNVIIRWDGQYGYNQLGDQNKRVEESPHGGKEKRKECSKGV